MRNKEEVDLNLLRDEENPTEQSLALNRIVLALLKQQKESNKRMFIIIVFLVLLELFTVVGFLWYESGMNTSTTTTTTTVTQDTGEGEGNNVFQTGESAVYNEGR